MYYNLLALVGLLTALTSAQDQTCAPTLKDPPPQMLRCGLRGVLTKPRVARQNFIGTSPADTPEICAQRCLDTSDCRFFAYNGATPDSPGTSCTTYRVAGERMGAQQRARSPLRLYNMLVQQEQVSRTWADNFSQQLLHD